MRGWLSQLRLRMGRACSGGGAPAEHALKRRPRNHSLSTSLTPYQVIDYGFNLVISDVDAVWFRDPAPLFDRHKLVGACGLKSSDGGSSSNKLPLPDRAAVCGAQQNPHQAAASLDLPITADVLVGLDHGESINAPGDDGLETFFHPDGCDFNTGGWGACRAALVSSSL